MDMFREWKRGDYQKKLWNGTHQEEENKVDLNLPGRKGLEDWNTVHKEEEYELDRNLPGRKGLEDWNGVHKEEEN